MDFSIGFRVAVGLFICGWGLKVLVPGVRELNRLYSRGNVLSQKGMEEVFGVLLFTGVVIMGALIALGYVQDLNAILPEQ